MQWMSLGLVIVFGSLTLYFHDPRFVMVKFTIAHIAIGVVMLKPNWMARYLPPIVTETLSTGALTIYSALWPLLMFGLAAANLYIGLTMSARAWAWFLGTVPTAAPLGAVRHPISRDPRACDEHPAPPRRGCGGVRAGATR